MSCVQCVGVCVCVGACVCVCVCVRELCGVCWGRVGVLVVCWVGVSGVLVARRVCTGGELPTPRGAPVFRGREWCSPVRASSRVLGWESHALVGPLLVKGFAVWPVVCRRLGLLRETTSYVVAPRLTCLPSALLLCGARLLGRLCASHTLPVCPPACGTLGRWLRWRVWRLEKG